MRTFVVIAALALMACNRSRKLDEIVFYDGRHFDLKVVRYFENLPLHYVGEVFTVQCRSAATASLQGGPTYDDGWLKLGNGGAIGTKSAAEIVGRERANYRVVDDRTLVWFGNGINVTFNACESFGSWYPTPMSREPNRPYRFELVKADPKAGSITVAMHRDDRTITLVESRDRGATWNVIGGSPKETR